jgi:acetylornithine deacetylase/succinyl-diaminopimelate desuccinylase-like protein
LAAATGGDRYRRLPKPADAGNVLPPYTTAKLSLRLPPTLDAAAAGAVLSNVIEKSPPYEARGRFEAESSAAGWNAPVLSP